MSLGGHKGAQVWRGIVVVLASVGFMSSEMATAGLVLMQVWILSRLERIQVWRLWLCESVG